MKKLAILLCLVLALSVVPVKVAADAANVAAGFAQEFVGVHNGEDIYRLVLSVSSPVSVFSVTVVLSFCNSDIQPVAAVGFADIHPTAGGRQTGMFRPLQVFNANGVLTVPSNVVLGTNGWVIDGGRSAVAYILTYIPVNLATGQQQLFAFYYRVIGSKDASTFEIIDFSEARNQNFSSMTDEAGIFIISGNFQHFYWGKRNPANSNIPAANVTLTYTNSYIVRRTLQSVDAGNAITGVPNGATVDELGLPTTVRLITVPPLPQSQDTVNVTWDTSAYDPANENTQTFTANGTITLPAVVRDPGEVAGAIVLSVTVNEVITQPPTEPPTTQPLTTEPITTMPITEPVTTESAPTQAPTANPIEPPTTPTQQPTTAPLTDPAEPPTPHPTQPSYTPSDEPSSSTTPPTTQPITISANEGAVPVVVRLSRGGTVANITLPVGVAHEIIETSDGTVTFDMSTLLYATTAILPHAAMQAFANAELGIKFLLAQGYVYFSAVEVYALLQAVSGNVSFALLAQHQTCQEQEIAYIPAVPPQPLSINFATDSIPFICPATGYLMLPLRIIAESLGAYVAWCDVTYTVYIFHNGQEISLTIGQPLPSTLGTPVIVGGRTFVPAEYIMEVLGADIHWCQATFAVYVYAQKPKENS